MRHALSSLQQASQFPIAIDLAHHILPVTCQASQNWELWAWWHTVHGSFLLLHPRFDLVSLADASHSWVSFLVRSCWWNQTHKDWIKSKVQGIPESKSLQKNLSWGHSTPGGSTWDPERGSALERSAPEGMEQRQKARSSDSPSWYAAPPPPDSTHTQLASTMPSLCGPSPHSQGVCLFQSYHSHTQDSSSCAATPLLHCTTVSSEMKVKTSMFALSMLNLEGKCCSTDGRELGARDELRFKTNPMSQFCRLFEAQAFLCSEHMKTFLQSWP